MSERWPWLRWVFLLVAVVLVIVFLVAQRQGDVDVSYATSPAGRSTVREATADVTLPSVDEMTDMVARERVVRLPGSIAYWDTDRVAKAIGAADIRILVVPPGLGEKQQDQVRAVKNATIRVMGTEVVGSVFQAVPDDLAGWRTTLSTGDVTDQLLSLVASERKQPDPPAVNVFSWRPPAPAELAPVVADLRAHGLHVAQGASVTRLPDNASAAFGGRRPLVAVLPPQPGGQPVPEFGPALVKAFPDTPVVVMYGYWVGYYGPHAGEFADVASAGFYARFGGLLSTDAYPQSTVLAAYLDKVTDVRYAGLFDRPLPYQPLDPLRVALPWLPWVFAACVLVFLGLSVRSVLGPRGGPPRRPPGRLAGLTTLAVELSALSHSAALTRALGTLSAAREALAENLPDRHVSTLLADAQRDLDVVARDLGRTEYRPVNYLAGGLSWRG